MIPGLCSAFFKGGSVGGFTVIASPSAVYGNNGQVLIGPSVATPIGGSSPYIYAWEIVGGDGSISADTPASASTNFSCSSLNPGDSKSAFFTCTVTDSASTVALSNQVITNFSLST